MNAKLGYLLITIGLLMSAAPLHSQIRNTEGSANLLAMNCSASSGYAATGYEEYSRRLAKTLGVLSGEQQRRVFGYLPTPYEGGTAGNDSAEALGNTSDSATTVATNSASNSTTSNTDSSGGSRNSNGDSGNSSNSGSNSGSGLGLIEQVVDTTNKTVTSVSDTVAPVVESTTGVDLAPVTDTVTNTTKSTGSTANQALQQFWNSIISWFQSMQK